MYGLYRFNYIFIIDIIYIYYIYYIYLLYILYIYILYIFFGFVVSAGWIKLISKSPKGYFAQPTVRFGRQIFKCHDSLPSQKHRSVASMRAQTQRSFPCRTSRHLCKSSVSGRFLFFQGVTVLNHQALECFFVKWLLDVFGASPNSRNQRNIKMPCCHVGPKIQPDFIFSTAEFCVPHLGTYQHSQT